MCRDTDWSYGPICVFFRAFCSLQAEGLFGQSFSVAPPIQALRGLPCLAPSLLFSACRDTEGSPWLGSYSVDRCVRHLRGTLRGVLFFSSAHQVFNRPDLLFSCRCWCVRRERLWWWLHLLWVTQQYCFALVTACLSSTGISHRDLLSHIPSIHFSAVSSSPRPGIAPQSVNSSCCTSQQTSVPIRVCMAVAIQILIPFRLPQISYFTLSLKCFFSGSDNCPAVGIGPLVQFPHPLKADPVLLTLLFPPIVPLSYRVLCGSFAYSFPLVRYSCLLSTDVLHALLCLKVYS